MPLGVGVSELFSNEPIIIANAHKQLIELETKPLLNKIEEDKPKVTFVDAIKESDDSIDVGSFSKIVKDEGIDLGRNKLFLWLRNNKYLMKNNQPYQKYIDMDIFELIEYSYLLGGETKIGLKTLVTTKGQVYLINKMKDQLF